MLPPVIDVHVHLTRTVRQEKVVFPRTDYPDEWRWANEERVSEYLTAESVDAIVAVNYMVVPDMFEQRRARHPEAAEHEIWDELRGRVRDFNTWILDVHREDPRVVPFVCCDIGTWRDTDTLMAELERCIGLGAMGVKMHPGLGRYFPGDTRMFPLYARLEEAGLPILSDTGSLRRGPGDDVYGMPDHFLPVFERFGAAELDHGAHAERVLGSAAADRAGSSAGAVRHGGRVRRGAVRGARRASGVHAE